jgi:hypothetical protein
MRSGDPGMGQRGLGSGWRGKDISRRFQTVRCALNVHSLTRSHAEMLKSKSVGGTSRSCSQYCIEHLGGELVLSSGATVFRLGNQSAAREYAGQKAKVVGTLDAKTKTVHIVSIVPETQPPHR